MSSEWQKFWMQRIEDLEFLIFLGFIGWFLFGKWWRDR